VNADDLMSQCLQLLQGAIRASGLTQTEVDQRIGRRKGYLSHVFQRRVDLKLIDLMQTLEVLGLDPRRFFGALTQAAASGGSGVLELLATRLEAEEEQGRAAMPVPAPTIDRSLDPQLEDRVRQTLRALLSQVGDQRQRSPA
jgi:hypothetical protein